MIYTSYFASSKYSIDKAVSIALYTPAWFRSKTLQQYLALAPSPKLLKSYKEMCAAGRLQEAKLYYIEEYFKQLSSLDPAQVYSDLNEKVLLCYEKTGDFCHRSIVVAWLRQAGYEATEL